MFPAKTKSAEHGLDTVVAMVVKVVRVSSLLVYVVDFCRFLYLHRFCILIYIISSILFLNATNLLSN